MKLTPERKAQRNYRPCFNCQEEPTACWYGQTLNLFICEKCARKVLPRLLEDATGPR